MKCITCESTIESIRSTKKYCSPNCRLKAYRFKHRGDNETLTVINETLSVVSNETLTIPRKLTMDEAAMSLGYMNYKHMLSHTSPKTAVDNLRELGVI